MTAIKSLLKRLDKLEAQPNAEPDIVELVLSSLEDEDLELLHEHATLRETGFNEDQIAIMMGDRYKRFQKAVTHFQDGYEAVLSAFRQEGKRVN
jgi:hypothetical protein